MNDSGSSHYTAIQEAPKCDRCGSELTGETVLPPSPIPDLIGTNAVPNRTQEQSIRAFLHDIQSDVSRLDQHIANVSSVLEQLKTERQLVQSYIDEHAALLSPARRIFPEILGEIFIRCPPGSKRKRLPEVLDSFDPKHGPMVLTQVCRTWRSVALSIPSLWTRMRIVVKSTNQAHSLQLVNLWLERSRKQPLNVGIMEWKTPLGSSADYPPRDWSTREIVTAVLSEPHRWGAASLMLPSSPTTWESLSAIKGNLPNLKSLTLHLARGEFPQDYVLTMFENAPQLSHLCLDFGISLSRLRIPTSQITSFEFSMHRGRPPSTNMCLAAIQDLPNLDKCTLHCGPLLPWLPVTAVTHSRLRILSIIAEKPRDSSMEQSLSSLFLRLTLPGLRTLTVHANSTENGWNDGAFSYFVSKSPALEELTFYCFEASVDKFIEALREIPKLSYLKIQMAPNNTLLLTRMLSFPHPRPGSSPLLPRLLTLEMDIVDKLNWQPFGKLLLSRTLFAAANEVSRLHSVSFDHIKQENLEEMQDTLQDTIAELKQAGVYIDIRQQLTAACLESLLTS